MKKENYHLVILESPFENWNNKDVQDIFSAMVNLKKQGYQANYADGTLPVDTTDFLATHLLLYSVGDSLTPIMGYKTISLETCKKYNLVFPGLSLVKNAQAPLHTNAVEKIIARCEEENRSLAYLGSWTVAPVFKQQNQDLKADLRNAFKTFYRLLYQEQNISEVIIGGTLRFGTEKIFSQLGHRPLQINGGDLPHINVKHLMNEPVIVMHSQEPNRFPQDYEQAWRVVWDNRTTYSSNTTIIKKAS